VPRANLFESLLFLVAVAVSATGCGNGQKVDRDRSMHRYDLAVEMLGKREYEAAVSEANKALAYDPSNHRAHRLLGLVDLRRASDIAAILEIEDCLTGVDAEGLGKKKDEYLLAARQRFVDAIGIDREYGEAYQDRAQVDLLLGDVDKAVEGFKEALANAAQLDNVSLTRTNLGWAYFQLADYPSAASELRQALRFQPAMCLAHYRLGRVYFARKEWDKALQEFEKVVEQPNECPIQEAHLYLMKTYAETGLGASLPKLSEGCVSLAPKSCVAAQCRALVP